MALFMGVVVLNVGVVIGVGVCWLCGEVLEQHRVLVFVLIC